MCGRCERRAVGLPGRRDCFPPSKCNTLGCLDQLNPPGQPESLEVSLWPSWMREECVGAAPAAVAVAAVAAVVVVAVAVDDVVDESPPPTGPTCFRLVREVWCRLRC